MYLCRVFIELLCIYVYLLFNIYVLFMCHVIIDRSVHSCLSMNYNFQGVVSWLKSSDSFK